MFSAIRLSMWIIVGCNLTALANNAYSEHLKQYTYLVKTGAAESHHTWSIQQVGKELETRWIAPDKAFTNICDESGDTSEWRVRYEGTQITTIKLDS